MMAPDATGSLFVRVSRAWPPLLLAGGGSGKTGGIEGALRSPVTVVRDGFKLGVLKRRRTWSILVFVADATGMHTTALEELSIISARLRAGLLAKS
jgi:hypothetical protein